MNLESEQSANRRIAWIGAALGGGLIAALVVIAWTDWDWGRSVFSHLCHQRSERCFVISGTSMAVCTRSLGIYAGIVAGCVATGLDWFGGRAVFWATAALVGSLGANGVDFVLEQLDVYSNLLYLRFALGLGLGFALAWFVFARLSTRRVKS